MRGPQQLNFSNARQLTHVREGMYFHVIWKYHAGPERWRSKFSKCRESYSKRFRYKAHKDKGLRRTFSYAAVTEEAAQR